MFLKGKPATWFERAVQPYLYRWNKFRSSLEINFGSFGSDWERRMIKQFRNCTDDSSYGGFGRDEGMSPSNVSCRDVGDDSDDSDVEEDPKEDPKKESDGDKTQEKGVVHEG